MSLAAPAAQGCCTVVFRPLSVSHFQSPAASDVTSDVFAALSLFTFFLKRTNGRDESSIIQIISHNSTEHTVATQARPNRYTSVVLYHDCHACRSYLQNHEEPLPTSHFVDRTVVGRQCLCSAGLLERLCGAPHLSSSHETLSRRSYR